MNFFKSTNNKNPNIAWQSKLKSFGVFFGGLLAGGVISYIFLRPSLPIPQLTKLHPANAHYSFISPVLATDVGEKKEFTEYKPLQDEINKIVQAHIASGLVTNASYYFRDLETGRWTGNQENDQFSPGSLLKIPILVTYLKKAESDPSLLQKKFAYQSKVDANAIEITKPALAIAPSQVYTVEELLKYMIAYSDNNATNLLYDNIDLNSLNEIYSDLGINYSEDKISQDFVSTKQYSLIFRILYSATYLNAEFSEKALQLLSLTDFKNGLVAGVPNNIVVAHKFGERVFNINGVDVTKEMHDCGIIYYPNHPYLLCVMTKGKDLPQLEKTIAEISQRIFETVKAEYKN